MKWLRVKATKDELERQEAHEALTMTREQAARIRRKQAAARGVFQRIHRIHEENHIAEAVRNLMEGRIEPS